MKKLRVVIVGFGFMGKTHAKNILQSECMELVAIVDSQLNLDASGGNINTGEWDSDALKGVHTYSQLDECLKKESLDLAFICVHTQAHYDLGMKSLQYGLHVFIEKPFVLDIKQGEELIAEACKQKKYLGVAHVVRFMPAYSKLREFYQNQTYGDLKFISMSRFSGVPNWGDWVKNRSHFGSSGGALFDLVIHDIDFLQYVLGEPDEVDSRILPGALSKHDYVCAFWKYKNKDIQVKVEGGNIFPSLFPFEASFQVNFERATLVYRTSNAQKIQLIEADTTHFIELDDPNLGYKYESEYFAHCIFHKQEPAACSANSSLNTIKLCYQHIRF